MYHSVTAFVSITCSCRMSLLSSFYPWLSATRGRALLRSLQGQLNFQPTLREEGLNLCEDVVHLYAMVMQAQAIDFRPKQKK